MLSSGNGRSVLKQRLLKMTAHLDWENDNTVDLFCTEEDIEFDNAKTWRPSFIYLTSHL